MKRRKFITLLGGTAAAWPLAARAQQPERMRRIGEPIGARVKLNQGLGMRIKVAAILVIVATAFFPGRVAAQYKQEFKMSVIPNRETSWGRAAIRFADGVKFRTNGRIQIKTYFDGQLFAGQQTTEFQLLQQGVADFVIGSTINWSPQVKELNLFTKTWISLNPEDRQILREVGELMMAVQKKEAREGLENAAIVIDVLEKIYQMDVTHLSPADVEAFRDKTRSTYNKWADDIGVELVRSTEKIVERTK